MRHGIGIILALTASYGCSRYNTASGLSSAAIAVTTPAQQATATQLETVAAEPVLSNSVLNGAYKTAVKRHERNFSVLMLQERDARAAVVQSILGGVLADPALPNPQTLRTALDIAVISIDTNLTSDSSVGAALSTVLADQFGANPPALDDAFWKQNSDLEAAIGVRVAAGFGVPALTHAFVRAYFVAALPHMKALIGVASYQNLVSGSFAKILVTISNSAKPFCHLPAGSDELLRTLPYTCPAADLHGDTAKAAWSFYAGQYAATQNEIAALASVPFATLSGLAHPGRASQLVLQHLKDADKAVLAVSGANLEWQDSLTLFHTMLQNSIDRIRQSMQLSDIVHAGTSAVGLDTTLDLLLKQAGMQDKTVSDYLAAIGTEQWACLQSKDLQNQIDDFANHPLATDQAAQLTKYTTQVANAKAGVQLATTAITEFDMTQQIAKLAYQAAQAGFQNQITNTTQKYTEDLENLLLDNSSGSTQVKNVSEILGNVRARLASLQLGPETPGTPKTPAQAARDAIQANIDDNTASIALAGNMRTIDDAISANDVANKPLFDQHINSLVDALCTSANKNSLGDVVQYCAAIDELRTDDDINSRGAALITTLSANSPTDHHGPSDDDVAKCRSSTNETSADYCKKLLKVASFDRMLAAGADGACSQNAQFAPEDSPVAYCAAKAKLASLKSLASISPGDTAAMEAFCNGSEMSNLSQKALFCSEYTNRFKPAKEFVTNIQTYVDNDGGLLNTPNDIVVGLCQNKQLPEAIGTYCDAAAPLSIATGVEQGYPNFEKYCVNSDPNNPQSHPHPELDARLFNNDFCKKYRIRKAHAEDTVHYPLTVGFGHYYYTDGACTSTFDHADVSLTDRAIQTFLCADLGDWTGLNEKAKNLVRGLLPGQPGTPDQAELAVLNQLIDSTGKMPADVPDWTTTSLGLVASMNAAISDLKTVVQNVPYDEKKISLNMLGTQVQLQNTGKMADRQLQGQMQQFLTDNATSQYMTHEEELNYSNQLDQLNATLEKVANGLKHAGPDKDAAIAQIVAAQQNAAQQNAIEMAQTDPHDPTKTIAGLDTYGRADLEQKLVVATNNLVDAQNDLDNLKGIQARQLALAIANNALNIEKQKYWQDSCQPGGPQGATVDALTSKAADLLRAEIETLQDFVGSYNIAASIMIPQYSSQAADAFANALAKDLKDLQVGTGSMAGLKLTLQSQLAGLTTLYTNSRAKIFLPNASVKHIVLPLYPVKWEGSDTYVDSFYATIRAFAQSTTDSGAAAACSAAGLPPATCQRDIGDRAFAHDQNGARPEITLRSAMVDCVSTVLAGVAAKVDSSLLPSQSAPIDTWNDVDLAASNADLSSLAWKPDVSAPTAITAGDIFNPNGPLPRWYGSRFRKSVERAQDTVGTTVQQVWAAQKYFKLMYRYLSIAAKANNQPTAATLASVSSAFTLKLGIDLFTPGANTYIAGFYPTIVARSAGTGANVTPYTWGISAAGASYVENGGLQDVTAKTGDGLVISNASTEIGAQGRMGFLGVTDTQSGDHDSFYQWAGILNAASGASSTLTPDHMNSAGDFVGNSAIIPALDVKLTTQQNTDGNNYFLGLFLQFDTIEIGHLATALQHPLGKYPLTSGADDLLSDVYTPSDNVIFEQGGSGSVIGWLMNNQDDAMAAKCAAFNNYF